MVPVVIIVLFLFVLCLVEPDVMYVMSGIVEIILNPVVVLIAAIMACGYLTSP